MVRARRHDPRTFLLYVRAILREFRWTLCGLAFAVLLGGFLFWLAPGEGGVGLHPLDALLASWLALLNQPFGTPRVWYLAFLVGFYPLVGFFLVGEGVVRFVLLMSSRKKGEREWMRVMASTYRDHVVVCGLGHVGFRVLECLLADRVPVVAVESDPASRYLDRARATGIPILLRDMRDDTTLVEACVPHARAIVIATNNDIGNLEVALDARRMNPGIRIVMRLFDDQIAAKFKSAGMVDEAFSTSALAAPVVARMALPGKGG